MKKLSLLILCLLAICNSFSQNDTLTKYVILTENQAKSTIKDLVAYDGLKLVSIEQNNRIINLEQQNFTYWRIINTKDSIIGKKDEIIKLQDKFINNKQLIEFHTYVGVSTYNLSFSPLSFYGKFSIEFNRFNLQAQLNYLTTSLYNIPNIYYNLNFEYKIF